MRARYPIRRQIPLVFGPTAPAAPHSKTFGEPLAEIPIETFEDAVEVCFPLRELSEQELYEESLRLFPPT